MITISILSHREETLNMYLELCHANPSFSLAYAGGDLLPLFSKKTAKLTDVLIVDADYITNDPIKVIHKLNSLKDDLCIIQVLAPNEIKKLRFWLGIGLDGIMPLSADLDEIKDGISNTFLYKKWIHPSLSKNIFEIFSKGDNDPIFAGLKSKSIKVLALLSEGKAYLDIAKELNVSVDVIRYYIKDIYKTLQVNNKGAAINAYLNGQIKQYNK